MISTRLDAFSTLNLVFSTASRKTRPRRRPTQFWLKRVLTLLICFLSNGFSDAYQLSFIKILILGHKSKSETQNNGQNYIMSGVWDGRKRLEFWLKTSIHNKSSQVFLNASNFLRKLYTKLVVFAFFCFHSFFADFVSFISHEISHQISFFISSHEISLGLSPVPAHLFPHVPRQKNLLTQTW